MKKKKDKMPERISIYVEHVWCDFGQVGIRGIVDNKEQKEFVILDKMNDSKQVGEDMLELFQEAIQKWIDESEEEDEEEA